MKISEIAHSWFQQALELSPDEELFIPVSTKREQKFLTKEILTIIEQYAMIDQIKASKIDVVGTYREGQQWVKIYMKATSPLVGFKRTKDGGVTRIALQDEESRLRKIKLMIQDGISKEEVLENLGLTEEEILQFYGGEDKDKDSV